MLSLIIFKTIKTIVFNLSYKIIQIFMNKLSFTTNDIFNLPFTTNILDPTLFYEIFIEIFNFLFSYLPFLGYGITRLLYDIFNFLFPRLLYEIFNLLFSTLPFLLYGIVLLLYELILLYELKIDLLPIFKDLLDELTINLRLPPNLPDDSNQQDPNEPGGNDENNENDDQDDELDPDLRNQVERSLHAVLRPLAIMHISNEELRRQMDIIKSDNPNNPRLTNTNAQRLKIFDLFLNQSNQLEENVRNGMDELGQHTDNLAFSRARVHHNRDFLDLFELYQDRFDTSERLSEELGTLRTEREAIRERTGK